MLSALIHTRRGYSAMRLAPQPINRRSVQHGPLVLVSEPRKFPAPTIDRDRTVSRRSEPSSRATLMGEGGISLLSPEYLLSFERCPFHTETPDHYALVSYLCDLSVLQSSTLMPLHSTRPVTNRPEGTFRSLRYAFGGDHPSQTTRQTMSSIYRS